MAGRDRERDVGHQEAAAASGAPPTLLALFGDDMVLQQGCHAQLWGTTEPGAFVIRVGTSSRDLALSRTLR